MSLRSSFALFSIAWLWALSISATEVVWPTTMERASIRRAEDYLQPTVSGKTESALFGMVREEGKRFHEGIDLGKFARRLHEIAGADGLDRERFVLAASLVRDIVATLRQSHGEVDRHSGFAYPALAAGNADDLGGFKLAHALPLCAVPPIG